MNTSFRFRSTLRLLAIGSLISGLCGCTDDGVPRLYPVQMKILSNGEPVADAAVAFDPVLKGEGEFSRPANGYTNAEGIVAPWMFREGDGLPLGKYRVGVIARVQVGGPEVTESTTAEQYSRVKWEWKVPERYMNPETSGIEVEVTKSGIVPDVLNLESL